MTATPETVRTVRPDELQLQGRGMRTTIAIFIIVPLVAVVLAIPVAWGGWLSWTDIGLAVLFWAITGLGITVGYHRYFTHGGFKVHRFGKIMLGIMGSMALQGSIRQWVADHRKHHKYSDDIGDPHSPWRFGTSRRAIARGLYFAHIGWLFDEQQTSIEKYAPDIKGDKDLEAISRWFPAIVAASLLLPAVLGGLITWSWAGALTAFFWAGLVRISLLHHVTWSINSVCHVFGTAPFESRDRSTNVWWLALPAFGESWHNLHHAEPTAARHGVLKGQVDISALIIRGMEITHIAHDVRWPKPERVVAKLKDPSMAHRVRGYRAPTSV
jgi:stearoyl-CoA desaturase (delta-9 desaturase)